MQTALISRHRTLLGLLLAVGLALPGCSAGTAASFNATFPSVVTGVEEAITILDQIADFVRGLVAGVGAANAADVTARPKIEAALASARSALGAVAHATSTAKDLSDKDLQASLNSFATSFAALEALTVQVGIHVDGATPTKMSRETLTLKEVSRPLLLDLARPHFLATGRGAR